VLPWVRALDSICFFFQAEDGIRDFHVTGVQTCALPIFSARKVADVIPNKFYTLALDSIVQFQFRMIMPKRTKIRHDIMPDAKGSFLGDGHFVEMRLHCTVS